MGDDYWDPFADPAEVATITLSDTTSAHSATSPAIADPCALLTDVVSTRTADSVRSSVIEDPFAEPEKVATVPSVDISKAHSAPSSSSEVRGNSKGPWTCPICEETNKEIRKECNNCGNERPPETFMGDKAHLKSKKLSSLRVSDDRLGHSRKSAVLDRSENKPAHTRSHGESQNPVAPDASESGVGEESPAPEKCRTNSKQSSPSRTSDSSLRRQPPLTFEQALEIQDQLIEGYMRIEFQEELWTSMGKAFPDKVEMTRAQTNACFPVQASVLPHFGFEPTRKGVHDSVKAFYPYNDIPECKARGTHLSYLVTPWQQDVTWKGQVRRKRDPVTGKIDNTILAPLLSRKQGYELEQMLIEAYSKEEFQEELQIGLEKAGGNEMEEIKARKRICLPIQGPIVQKFGFEPTRDGVRLSTSAFRPLAQYSERQENQIRFAALMKMNASLTAAFMKGDRAVVESVSARMRVDSDSKQTFVPGVGLTLCEAGQNQQSNIEEQDVTILQKWPVLKLPEHGLVCAQFLVDAPYPEVVRKLSQIVTPDSDDSSSKHSSAPADRHGAILIVNTVDCMWMQELLSSSKAVEGGITHRISIVHTVAPALTKEYANQKERAQDLWQRRLYSYTEVTDLFRISLPGEHRTEKTFIARSICSLETHSLFLLEPDMHALKVRLADNLEDYCQKWISSCSVSSDGSDASEGACVQEFPQNETAENQIELTLAKAIDLQDRLIEGYRSREFQEKIHAASKKAAGDALTFARMQGEICLHVQRLILPLFGFAATREGDHKSNRAFRSRQQGHHPEVDSRGWMLNMLVTPALQTPEFVEDVLSNFTQSSRPNYDALRLPELYKVDKEIVSLAASDRAAEICLRLMFQHVDPNIRNLSLGHEVLLYIEEGTALITAVDKGCQATFDVLLRFRYLVNIDADCCQWTPEGPFRRYTALDKAMASQHKCAPAMMERLLSLGAKSADELPRISRQNPFLKFQEYFPNAELTRLEEEDIAHFQWLHMKQGCTTGLFEAMEPNDTSLQADDGSSTSRVSPVGPARAWCWPDIPDEQDKALEGVIAKIKAHLNRSRPSSVEEQQRLFRQLFLEWHPDKQRENEVLASKVFQWLHGLRQKTI